MTAPFALRRLTAACAASLLLGACHASTRPPSEAPAPASPARAATPAASGMAHAHGAASAPVTIPAGATYTEADVRFMQGMIAHHAQAIHMSRMAPERGADPRLVRFANKIDLSQAGEIALMQGWLRAHGQHAPDTSSWRTTTMHGMLTADELARLEASRGAAFDRLFLEYMIRHHEGALRMVSELFATPRAAQDVDVSVLANDVEQTQTAEIGLMRQMLARP
ncbi:MAG TPA: DUF305 domain-containing protein [Gemmatimonadaceae bacterium]